MDISQYLTLSYLQKLLKSNAVSVGLVGISLLFIFQMNLAGLMVFVLILLVVPFSVYMLIVLYLHNRKKWIYSFLIGLAISFLPLVVFSDENVFLIAAKFSPLLFFVLYNMLLKAKVGEWLIEQDYAERSINE